MTDKITIVLAEDHNIVREGLKTLLEFEEEFSILAEAENGLEAIEMAKLHNPMVVIMDVALPKLNGLEATRHILKNQPDIKILMLTAYSDDGYVEKAISLGVSGFLQKQCSPPILIEAVRTVASGKPFFSAEVTNRLKQLQNAENNCISKNPNLSLREAQVLQLIAEGKANKQVASELEISIKTVEKHRQNLMNKLAIHDTAGLTRYAISEGIIECSNQNTTVKI